MPESERSVYKPAYAGDMEKPLAAREAEIWASLAKREGDAENSTSGGDQGDRRGDRRT